MLRLRTPRLVLDPKDDLLCDFPQSFPVLHWRPWSIWSFCLCKEWGWGQGCSSCLGLSRCPTPIVEQAVPVLNCFCTWPKISCWAYLCGANRHIFKRKRRDVNLIVIIAYIPKMPFQHAMDIKSCWWEISSIPSLNKISGSCVYLIPRTHLLSSAWCHVWLETSSGLCRLVSVSFFFFFPSRQPFLLVSPLPLSLIGWGLLGGGQESVLLPWPLPGSARGLPKSLAHCDKEADSKEIPGGSPWNHAIVYCPPKTWQPFKAGSFY